METNLGGPINSNTGTSFIENDKKFLITGTTDCSDSFTESSERRLEVAIIDQPKTIITRRIPNSEFLLEPVSGAYCDHCLNFFVTVVDKTYKTTAFVWMGVLCFIGILCGILPFCLNDMKKAVHYCPRCGRQLGVYNPKVRSETHAALAAVLIFGLMVLGVVVYYHFYVKPTLFQN